MAICVIHIVMKFVGFCDQLAITTCTCHRMPQVPA
jgi:hypothetical protein